MSAYATVGHLLLQLEEAGSEGRSPTGVGSPLTPLSAEEMREVTEPLRALRARLREAAALLAPDELAAFERPQSAHNTRVWLSNLLEKIRWAVDSLGPRPMRKYGPVTEAEEQAAADLHGELAGYVREARRALDARLSGSIPHDAE